MSTDTKIGLGGPEPKKIEVYDNGGKSFDRYTVIIDQDAYGMSSNPLSPQGFNQYIGDADDLDMEAIGELVDPILIAGELREAINRRAEE